MKTILVTGANGTVSSALLASLKGTKNKIRALVRTEAKGAALKKDGIDVVVGDLEHMNTLSAAFDGVDTAWLLCPASALAPAQMSNGINAARRAGVRHVVRMSAVGAAHDAPTFNSRMHALSDSELKSSGMAWTIVKPHFFMQNFMMAAQSVAKEGVMYMALDEGKMGSVDIRDIGEFAAKVLTSGGHEHKTYTLTGPASLSTSQVAEQLGAALKKPVKYQPVSLAQAAESMKGMGMDHWGVQMMGDYFAAYGNNWGDFVTNDFQTVVGHAPRSFADFAKDFAKAFGG